MRALALEVAELLRIARHCGFGRTAAEGTAVVSFVLALAFASLAIVDSRDGSPSPATGSGVMVAEARR